MKYGGASDIPLSNGQSITGMKGVKVTVSDQVKMARAAAESLKIPESDTQSVKSVNSNTDKLKLIEKKVSDEMHAVEKKMEGELWWIFQVRHIILLSYCNDY